MIEDFIDCRNYSVSRSLVDDAAVKSFFTRKNIALVKRIVVRRAVVAVRPELVACEHMLRDDAAYRIFRYRKIAVSAEKISKLLRIFYHIERMTETDGSKRKFTLLKLRCERLIPFVAFYKR